MRLPALALIAAAAATGWCQSARPVPPSPQNSTQPGTALPRTWLNSQQDSFGQFGAQSGAQANSVPVPSPAPNRFLLNPQFSPDLLARNQAPAPFPHAKGMPIPTEWPDAKFEPIPTDWPNLKFLLVNNSSQPQPKPKPALKFVK